jgi:hypothetical protein
MTFSIARESYTGSPDGEAHRVSRVVVIEGEKLR